MGIILVIGLCLLVVEVPLIRGACPNPSTPPRATINDTDIGKDIYSLEVDGAIKIDSFTVKLLNGALDEIVAHDYFTLKINAGNLTLSTTEAFKKLGNDADTNGDTKIGLSVNVKLVNCSQVLTFLVFIQNTFANQPIFSESAYKYALPMPIMPRSDFTVYGQKIAVSDVNFANTQMTMTISPEDFDVTVGKIDNKHFEAVFSAKKYLRFTESRTYTLTAMNSGSRQSQVDITIDVDAANGLDQPSFDKPCYFFEYSNGGTASLQPKDGDVVVKSNKPNNGVYELTGDSKEYFDITFDNASHFSLALNPDKPLPSDVPSQIALALSFTTDSTGYTAIIVDVITVDIIPSFSTDHYTGKYDIITNQIDCKPQIDIKNATNVKLSDDAAKVLKIDPKDYKISPITSLEKGNFDENLNLVFTVFATSTTENEARALVVLSFVTKKLKFDNSYYTATYSENNGIPVVTLDNGNDIGFSDVKDLVGIEIQVANDYKINFEIKLDNNSKWTISVSDPLSEFILNENTKLTIPLSATWPAYEETASSVLILNLPERTGVKFDKPYYTGSYVKGGDKDSVELNGEIHLTGGAKADEITLKVEGFEENFVATYNRETSLCEIAVKTNLNSSIIGHDSQLVITIVAFSSVLNSKSYAALILDLPVQTSSIEFEKRHYHATYKETGSTATITVIDGPIKITNNDQLNLNLSFEGHEDDFRVTWDPKTSTCGITVQSNLDPSVIEGNSQLVLTLTAVSVDKKLTTYTVIILDLPSKTIEFERKHYSATYELDSDSVATVNIMDGPVKILNENGVKLDFFFEDFDTNFEMIYNAESSTYIIHVKSNLDSTVVADKTQLIITVTARTADNDPVCYTTLILALPNKKLSVTFAKKHYYAKYSLGVDSKAQITVVDGPIKISNEKGLSLQFSYEGYEDYLRLKDIASGTYEVEMIKTFNNSVFESQNPLVISIVASTKDAGNLGYTVLTVVSPQEQNSIAFAEEYYVAHYQTDPELQVSLTKEIVLNKKSESKITFSFKGYDDNFQVEYVALTKSYSIKAKGALNDNVLSTNNELLIVLTAEEMDSHNTASTVLILKLPSYLNDAFESNHYAAVYKLRPEFETDAISMIDTKIKIKSAEYTAISFTGFEDNFEGSCDTATLECTITVKENLNSTILCSTEELIVTVVASSGLQPVPGKTVLVLKLPLKNSTFAFSKQYYNAVYSIQKSGSEKATVSLDGLVSLIGADVADVSIVLDAYSDYFELSHDSTSWNLHVKENLGPEILRDKTELVASLTATKQVDSESDYAKATLIIKLPDKTTVSFSKTQYYGEYLVDEVGGAKISLDGDTDIETTDTDNTKIELNNFSELFLITLNSGAKWSIDLQNQLNTTILCQYTELRLQMTLTKTGVNYGEAGLTIRLPPLSFSKDIYSGLYSIDENGGGSVDVEDISLGDIDASYIEVKLMDYIDYFKLTQKSTSWNVEVANKLPEVILNKKSELILTLTATKSNQTGSDLAKATVLIKLPDDTSVAFTKPQYYGKYVMGDPSALVVLDDDSEIAITDSVNSKIALDSFANNFRISMNTESKWTVNVAALLNSSILTEYSELKLLLTITKLGINYGEAGLYVKLPSLKFSKDKYTGLYSFLASGVDSVIVDDITMDNVDASYIQLKLMEYADNFYPEKSDDKWTIKVKKPLSADITDRQLVTKLQAIRQSDETILATTVLVISLPSGTSTDAPVFSAVTFNGDYINSDSPIVKMEKLISLVDAESASLSTVYINASNEFSTSFNLVQEKDNQYSVEVEGRLSPEVLDEETNVALTLVATSTEGNNGYATLVISLPKAVRNTSVQVENHEILFTGTYKNGLFTSPKIPLVTNSTNQEDILVKMSNDLGIDSKHFSYKYSHGILAVNVDDIPDDVLKSTSLIPLKLAITDRNTQDTIYAVLNVEITTDNGGASSTGPDRIGLIVAVSILAALLVLLVLFVSCFWFFRLRANKYVEMKEEEETGTKPPLFTKNPAKISTPSITPPRRPTGISVGLTDTLAEESSSDKDVPVPTDADPSIYTERKVAFNEVVEKIEENGEEDEHVEAPEELLSVADRRPTQFVFAYPLETGVLDDADDSEESSDYQVGEPTENTREKKKSVIFNEYIERRHIEPLEDGNEGAESDDLKISKSTSELAIESEKQLPSEIFKEIF